MSYLCFPLLGSPHTQIRTGVGCGLRIYLGNWSVGTYRVLSDGVVASVGLGSEQLGSSVVSLMFSFFLYLLWLRAVLVEFQF